MAERFVFGFVVSVDAMQGLVSSQLDADELLATVSSEFVDMFDDEFTSEISLNRCMRDVLAGNLDEDLAYPYTRLVEPVLTVVAEPLGMIHMAQAYYLPNDRSAVGTRHWKRSVLLVSQRCGAPRTMRSRGREGVRRSCTGHASPRFRRRP